MRTNSEAQPDLAAEGGRPPARPRSDSRLAERLSGLLAFRAPYLEDKLLRLGTVASRDEAAALFQEVKKYLVLAEVADAPLPMLSQRIDDVWHQFVLFTRQYAEFCAEFAGRFLHHEPLESPGGQLSTNARRRTGRAEFAELYEHWFGPLPQAWRDDLGLKGDTRLGWSEWATPPCTRLVGGSAELCQDTTPLVVLCRASEHARAALEFMAGQRVFLVRELPGLSPTARVALCQPLVEADVLHLMV